MLFNRSMLVNEIASIVKNKVSTSELTLDNYISTDNMLPNYSGIQPSTVLPSGKATAFCPPKIYAYRQLAQVVFTGTLGQRRKQEVHKFSPGKPFGKLDRLPPHCMRSSIHGGEIHAVNTAYHLPPRIRVKNPIQ